MRWAVFLDRDGVINYNVLNRVTGKQESPHCPDDFNLFPWTIKSLKKFQDLKFLLFLLSNQPSYAKGKTSFENLTAIHNKLHHRLTKNKIYFSDYFYCYHHPKGIIPELSIKCNCRKPGTFFIEKAVREYSLDLKYSWIVGDRDSDIICGKKAGLHTIRVINSEYTSDCRTDCRPDFIADNLYQAAEIIEKMSMANRKDIVC